jgi:predicted AAA+ superfamily ATPase
MYPRIFNPVLSQSCFLFGARQTRQSTFLRQLLKNQPPISFDRLDEEEATGFRVHPKLLEGLLAGPNNHPQLKEEKVTDHQWIMIDEIQRVPVFLNEVHRLIE